MATDQYRVSVSGQAIVARALRMIHVLEAGETMSAEEQQDGIEALNHMLDAWNTESLNVLHRLRNAAALTPSTNPHTIGPATGNLDLLRPQRIDDGEAFVTGGGLGNTEQPLKVYTQAEWGAIPDKTVTGTPRIIYYEPSFPLGKAWINPIPDAAYNLVLYTWQLLSQITNPTATIDFAPGYTDAIVHNLAVRLATEYGRIVAPEVAAEAMASKGRIKRMNSQPLLQEFDRSLGARGTSDITSGTFY